MTKKHWNVILQHLTCVFIYILSVCIVRVSCHIYRTLVQWKGWTTSYNQQNQVYSTSSNKVLRMDARQFKGLQRRAVPAVSVTIMYVRVRVSTYVSLVHRQSRCAGIYTIHNTHSFGSEIEFVIENSCICVQKRECLRGYAAYLYVSYVHRHSGDSDKDGFNALYVFVMLLFIYFCCFYYR